jgi:hypothetical protein
MKDLSSSLSWANGLNAGESMAGGNTTSVDPVNTAMKGPGSESVYPRPEATDDPNLEIPKPMTPLTTVQSTGGGKKADGGWTSFGISTGFKKAGE